MPKHDSGIDFEIYGLSACQLLERWSPGDPMWKKKYKELEQGALTEKLVTERFIRAHASKGTSGLIEFEREDDPAKKAQLFSELSLAERLAYLSKLS